MRLETLGEFSTPSPRPLPDDCQSFESFVTTRTTNPLSICISPLRFTSRTDSSAKLARPERQYTNKLPNQYKTPEAQPVSFQQPLPSLPLESVHHQTDRQAGRTPRARRRPLSYPLFSAYTFQDDVDGRIRDEELQYVNSSSPPGAPTAMIGRSQEPKC